jgi:hypothetical protein
MGLTCKQLSGEVGSCKQLTGAPSSCSLSWVRTPAVSTLWGHCHAGEFQIFFIKQYWVVKENGGKDLPGHSTTPQ